MLLLPMKKAVSWRKSTFEESGEEKFPNWKPPPMIAGELTCCGSVVALSAMSRSPTSSPTLLATAAVSEFVNAVTSALLTPNPRAASEGTKTTASSFGSALKGSERWEAPKSPRSRSEFGATSLVMKTVEKSRPWNAAGSALKRTSTFAAAKRLLRFVTRLLMMKVPTGWPLMRPWNPSVLASNLPTSVVSPSPVANHSRMPPLVSMKTFWLMLVRVPVPANWMLSV